MYRKKVNFNSAGELLDHILRKRKVYLSENENVFIYCDAGKNNLLLYDKGIISTPNLLSVWRDSHWLSCEYHEMEGEWPHPIVFYCKHDPTKIRVFTGRSDGFYTTCSDTAVDVGNWLPLKNGDVFEAAEGYLVCNGL